MYCKTFYRTYVLKCSCFYVVLLEVEFRTVALSDAWIFESGVPAARAERCLELFLAAR